MTDSTADIPPDLAEEWGLRVVPMTVAFGDEVFVSGVTMSVERFYDRLAVAERITTTSQPTPAWFEEAYADAHDNGARSVVSVHLSAELSGTCHVAEQVARHAPLPVTVVDSRQAGGALALAVFAASRAAERGASAQQVADLARHVAAEARVFFAVDSLEHLKRGGRLSGAQAMLGGVLRVRPILTIEDGRVVPLEKVRTWSKAVERLGALVADRAGGRPADVIVSHGLVPERAAAVWAHLRSALEVGEALETVIGPVVATHVGPGAVAVAVTTASV
ncbi:MAG TPA: DegV family protein [Nitriliruptorales bacterium]|nr:DegV family protein [Nitriliruptorales bacterium]